MTFKQNLKKVKEIGMYRSLDIFIATILFPIIRFHIYRNLYTFRKIGIRNKFFPQIEFHNPNMEIGSNIFINRNVRFGGSGLISIGDNTGIGAYSCMESLVSISIGKDCQIARFCYFIDHDHYFGDPDKTFIEQTNLENDRSTARPIIIEENCWIGTNVIILKGAHIGTGSIIGAGSVVTHSIPPHTVAAGVPAKVIKKLK